METKKTNFFAIPALSFVPNKYNELVKNSAGKIFGAIFVLFILLGAISGVKAMSAVNEIAEVVDANCPDFELTNGRFAIKEPFMLEQDGMLIAIDDSIYGITEDDIKNLVREKFYSQIIVIGSDSLGMLNNGQIQVMEFNQIKDFSFSKYSLVNELIPAFKPILLIIVVVAYMFAVALYYLAAWIMSLFTMIICKIMKKNIDSVERFRITVLAKLPIYLITFVIELLTPISINIFIGAILVIIYTCIVVNLFDDGSDSNYIEQQY